MRKKVTYSMLIVFGIIFVFYLSWIPNPDYNVHWYFPSWMVEWTNNNGRIRTGVPFIFLGALYEIIWNKARLWKNSFTAWVVFVVVVTVAEIGQIYLPQRHFDWQDIFWGSVGTAFGLLSGIILHILTESDK